MTLTNRLSWFFLWALGLVLVGYCATLYLLARSYLYNQVDERLDAALTILAAAIENEADGLKWDKEEHRLPLGKDSDPDQVRWMVYDEAGVAVDSSANLEGGDLLARADDARGGTPWRLTQKRVDATRFLPERAPADGERRYRFLLVTAGVSLEPVQTTLRNLALVLTGLSAGLWMVFVFAGRSLCRRGLGHLTQMAATARTMSAANLNQRLPNPQTKDELEDLAAGFNELLTRVQESFERQRRFTGDASHQLRTPLAAVLGQIEVALRRERPVGEYQRVLTLVQKQAEQLRHIVEMLLFLARAEGEAKLPNLESFDLAPWLKEHLQTWSGHPRHGDLRVDGGSAEKALCVQSHPPLLGQLVDNLLDNACKYSVPGKPINLQLRNEKNDVVLAVEDSGCGIPAEDLPHIFEPFYRSPRARQSRLSGTGLGLAVAKRIAEAFGGNLTVQSTVGQGSRFQFRLPQKNQVTAIETA
jgi:heavy metal sensor kinase